MLASLPRRYLVAFDGSLLYKPVAVLSEQFGAFTVRANVALSRYTIAVNGTTVLEKEYDTTKWIAEFATVQHTLSNIQADQLMELKVNGQLLDRLLVQPIYQQQFWELDPRTQSITLEAKKLQQFDGSYLWLSYRPAPRQFYTQLHTVLTTRILEFYKHVPAAAAKDAKLGETRYNLAAKFFPLSNLGTYEKRLWIAVLFGVSTEDNKESNILFEAISEASRPQRYWPDFDPSTPKAWLVKFLENVFSRVLKINDPDELNYTVWFFLLLLNVLFASLGTPEYEPFKNGSNANALTLEKNNDNPLQGVLLCFQTASSKIDGLQYFDSVPVRNMLVLRRIDNVMQIPEVGRTMKSKFAYGLSTDLPKLKPYAVDNSPETREGFNTELLKSSGLVGEQTYSQLPPALATIPTAESLPRIGRFSGNYYYTLSPSVGAYPPLGGMLYPTRIEVVDFKPKFEGLRPLFQLLAEAMKIRTNAFRYIVEQEFQQTLSTVVPFTLDANPQFPVALPAGSTLQWTKLDSNSGQQTLIRVRDQMTINVLGEESSAGIYRLDVSAPATATAPSLDDEILTFIVDFKLLCLRCEKMFSVRENGHGSCVFHAREQTDQGLQTKLSRFNPQRNFEVVDGVLLGAIALNPNVYYGIAQSSRTYEERWLCCRRRVPEAGCYVGRHSSTTSGPDLSDWLHNGPQRGTEWQLESRTSEESFQAIVKAYSEGRYLDGVRLEWQFNEVHGGVLSPSFHFVNDALGKAALEYLSANGFDSANMAEQLLRAVDFSRSFGVWQIDRSAQLAYQHGSPSTVEFPRQRAQRDVELVRVFRVLRNVPIQNPQRLETARAVIMQRWLALKTVPSESEAERLATQEAALLNRYSEEIRTILDEIRTKLREFLFTEQQLNARLDEMEQLINRQPTPAEFRLVYQYDTLRAEAVALALPFDFRYWMGNRIRFENWLREQFFASSNEAEFRQRVDQSLLALRVGQPVSFDQQRIDFGTADQFDTRNNRAILLLQQVEQNLTKLRDQLREDSTRVQEMVTLVVQFKRQFESTAANIQKQIARIQQTQAQIQKQAYPRNASEAVQLDRYRVVWQATDPLYFEQLYREVDTLEKVLRTSPDTTVKQAIVRELMRNNIADTARFLNAIVNDRLRDLPKPLLEALVTRLKAANFSTDISTALAYQGDLLQFKTLDVVDTRLSNFFRSMDRFTNPNGFHSLPVVERASNLLQEYWIQRSTSLNLQILDEATVLRRIPSNPAFLINPNGPISRRDLLQFYEQFINPDADLSRGPPAQIEILQRVSVGSLNVPIVYIELVRRWTQQKQIRNGWLSELKLTLNLLRETTQDFIASVLNIALTPENNAVFSRLINRPATEALLEYIGQNPGQISTVWAYLATKQEPTSQDPLVQTLAQLAREPRLIEKELGLAALPDINWPSSSEFAAYRSLLQQITIYPPTVPPVDSWFYQWYVRERGNPPQIPPTSRYYYNLANDLLNLLSTPKLSAYRIERYWQSSSMLELKRRFDEGANVQEWLNQFRLFIGRIAASAGNSTYQTAILATVGSLNDSVVVAEIAEPQRRWQYIHWGARFAPLLVNIPASDRISFAQLNQAYFEINGKLPAELDPSPEESTAVIIQTELARVELDQLRVGGSASTPASARENAATAGWLYHQVNRGDNDPIAFLVMAILLAGTIKLEGPEWIQPKYRAVGRAVLDLMRTIDQELSGLDLSLIQPALSEMRNNPRGQRIGVSYKRGSDDRQIDIAGSPFLLRPIWPAGGSTLSRAWFTVLSYPFEKSQRLRELRSINHLYLIEFLMTVGQSYFSEEDTELNNYLELVCDANSDLKPDALAYFVHAFVLHPLPNFANSTVDPLFSQLSAQFNVVPPAPNADSYARHLSNVQKLEHAVVRPLDPFDVTHAIGQTEKTPFELWLLLSGAVNPEAERTRIPIFWEESGRTFILYKSVHENSFAYYNDPPDFDRLLGENRHTLISLNSGAVTNNVNGFSTFNRLFDATSDRNSATVLELTPSLEVYWKQHQRDLRSLHQHILKTQNALYQSDAKVVEQQIDARLQQVYGRSDVFTRFFNSVQQEQNAVVVRIETTSGLQLLPNVEARLKEMIQQPFFEANFTTLLPDIERVALDLQQLHASNRNYTPYMAAAMQILITRLSNSLGELAPVRQELNALWKTLVSVVDNVLTHIATQTTEVVFKMDVSMHRPFLQQLEQKLRTTIGSNVAFDVAIFEAVLATIPQNGPLDVKFVNKPMLDQVQQELIGGSDGLALQQWSESLLTRVNEVTNELVQILNKFGQQRGNGAGLVIPPVEAPNLKLPLFSRSTVSPKRVRSNLSDLYMALFFQAWYIIEKLEDNGLLKRTFSTVIAPLVELNAQEILAWNERTGFWQPADALLSLGVLSRDLAILLDPVNIFEAAGLGRPSDAMLKAIDLSKAAATDPQIEAFVKAYVTQGGMINALSKGSADEYNPSFQTLIRVCNDVVWLTDADALLRDFTKSPSLRPRYNLRFKIEMQRALLALPEGDLFSNTGSVLHQLFDNWIRPTLFQLSSNWRFLASNSLEHVGGVESLRPLAIQKIDLRRVAFFPLLTSPKFDPATKQTSRLAEQCRLIAAWEAANGTRILSSRWPTKEFDRIRSQTQLRDFGRPADENAEVAAIFSADAGLWQAVPATAVYQPMFRGDPEVARRLESLFHFGVDSLTRAEMSQRYRDTFRHNPEKWLSYAPSRDGKLPLEFPAELAQIVTTSGQLLADVLPPQTTDMNVIAMWPYMGLLFGKQVRELYLRDAVSLSVAYNQHPVGFSMLSVLESRNEESASPPATLLRRWAEGTNEDNNFSHLVASSSVPSSPWGIDLYLAVNENTNLTQQWAVWENRLPAQDLSIAQSSVRYSPSGANSTEILLLRGLLDARELDRKTSAIVNLEHRASLVRDGPEPNLYYPVAPEQLPELNAGGFKPAFPFTGNLSGNWWPLQKILSFYSKDPPVRLAIMERANPSRLALQMRFYATIFAALRDRVEPNFPYPNVGPQVNPIAPPVQPWQNPFQIPIFARRPVMLLPDLTTL